MYINLPKGIHISSGNRNIHVLKLLKNLYGQIQARIVWKNHFTAGLLKVGFTQSKVDECVFYRGELIFMVYVDEGIFFCPHMHEIDKCILELRTDGYDIEDMGNINDYLGINFEEMAGNEINPTRPYLIDAILRDVGLT
jgi:hypothetical protein